MSHTLSIREVKKSDEPFLATIIKATFDEHNAPKEGTVYSDPTTNHLYDLFEIAGSVLWVAEWNDNIVGCCGIYPTEGLPKGTAELVKFYISPSARSIGIGRALIEKSIRSAIELGYEKIYLESLPQFSNAVNFYTRLGFKTLDQALGNSGHTSCNIWMLLNLET